jgi:hypothetical protein
MMELVGPDYTGSVACDPRRSGERRPVAFTLSNGEVNEWPLAATVSHDQALDAVSGCSFLRVWIDGTMSSPRNVHVAHPLFLSSRDFEDLDRVLAAQREQRVVFQRGDDQGSSLLRDERLRGQWTMQAPA